jgi:hypothetical protein
MKKQEYGMGFIFPKKENFTKDYEKTIETIIRLFRALIHSYTRQNKLDDDKLRLEMTKFEDNESGVAMSFYSNLPPLSERLDRGED